MKHQAAFTLMELPFDHLDKLGAGGLRAVRKRKSEAFTLIELLIVIGILAVLVTILVPIVGGKIEDARRTSCRANLKAIGQKMVEYAHDHKGRYPQYYSTNAAWNEIGDKNNAPGGATEESEDRDVKDGTRPLFMLIFEPYFDSVVPEWTHKVNDYIPPDAFICASDGQAEADPLDSATYPKQVGFASYNNVSYSYQHQHTAGGAGIVVSVLTSTSRIIMADKNPLTASSGTNVLEATGEAHDTGSANHNKQGHNILRADGSAEWTDNVDLGPVRVTERDTIWDPSNNLAGDLVLTGAPQDEFDVFLIP